MPVKGRMSFEEALTLLLRNTGLSFMRNQDDSYVIIKKSNGQSVGKKPSVNSNTILDNQGPKTLEEIVIVGTDQSLYRTGAQSTLTGFALDYLELPRVVNIISPQVAFNYRVQDNVSFFMSYSESFLPNEDFTFDQAGGGTTLLFDPDLSKQFEAGVKAQFFDNKLNFNVAVYKNCKRKCA